MPTSGRTTLVTGAAGFIGSHTAEALLRRGEHVVGLDNFNDYYDPARKRQNITEVEASAGESAAFELVEGDIRDRRLVTTLFERHRFTSVIHLAAMAGVRASTLDPWLYYDVNVTGTLNLLQAAAEHGRPNFVLASTSSVYGRTPTVPFVETDAADRPLAPYPASKRAAEMLAHAFHHLHALDVVVLRFFTVYGPRGRPDMMGYKVLDSIFSGCEVPLYNSGQMHRDWTFVTDIVSGVLAASDLRLGYEVVNLGRGEPVLLSEFVQSIERLAGAKARLVDAPMMDADVSYTFADIRKAERLLGYRPRVSVSEGVAELCTWYRKAIRGQ